MEDAAVFVDQLRKRGYYDTANDYLEYIKDKDRVSDEFKSAISYENAKNLVAYANSVSDARQSETVLLEAVEKFKDFAKTQSEHPSANQARLQISNVYVGLAKRKMVKADQPGANRSALGTEAREMLNSALKEAIDAETVIQAARKKIEPVDPDDEPLIEVRDKLRRDWLRSELLQCAILYEIAKTHPEGSDEAKEALSKTASEYGAMFDKHRRRSAGTYCLLQQGRCLQEMGDYDEALAVLVELVEMDARVPKEREFQLQALLYSMKCWIAQKKYDEAIKMGGVEFKAGEDGTLNGHALLFLVASAQQEKAQLEGQTPGDKQKLLDQAVRIYKKIAKGRRKSEWQAKAQAQLISLGELEETVTDEEPTDFDGAFSRALVAMQKRGVFKAAVASAADADKQATIDKAVAEAAKAFHYYRLAISFADGETPDAKLSNCHKALCYLFFDRGDHLRAAVVGEYLGRQYPNSGVDRFGSWIAFNSWLKVYSEIYNTNASLAAGAEIPNWRDAEFETRKIQEMAKRIVQRWPNSTEAVEASFQLIMFALQSKNIAAARKHLAGVPEDSPRRVPAEIKVGQLLWNRYATSKRLPEDARPGADELQDYLDFARKVLTDGLKRGESLGETDRTLLGGAYALAQLLADVNEPREAIRLLEHEKYGPLTLVEAGDPLAVAGGYAQRAYRLALRSYIAAVPFYNDDADVQKQFLDKAIEMMDKLEKVVESQPDAESRLNAIYIEMGRNLEIQIKNIEDEAGKAALSGAFEEFLKRIRNRPGDKTYKTLIWIAETFFTLGKANDSDEGAASQKAADYYSEAAKSYKEILGNPRYIKNPRQRTTIELRLASCYRRQGEFKKAQAGLVKILRRRAGNLTVQFEAAKTFYEAGVEDRGDYVKSMLGAEPDEETDKNIVWGWSKLARQTSGRNDFAAHFYLANLYAVRARRAYALSYQVEDKKKSKTILLAAKTTLETFHKQFPELGGEDSRRAFDAELKRIQEALGENPVGLPELQIETDEATVEGEAGGADSADAGRGQVNDRPVVVRRRPNAAILLIEETEIS